MKIVIMAGGTGSIALQNGLHTLLHERADELDIKIIVNAYDNGLSTGAVRQVLGGKILGPSDVRKNQTTQLGFLNALSPYRQFLDIRFTSEPGKAHEYCKNAIKNMGGKFSILIGDDVREIMYKAVDTYFAIPIASKIDYNDFSLANIIYAGLAAQNVNSLRAAASIMAEILDIPDNVIINDDTSLFLGAVTKSGIEIADEGDIVSWMNPADPIVDVFFTTETGAVSRPVLCEEAKTAIAEADVIILSSGTQWSSLIPTYASNGFEQAIAQSKAKILMVMNRTPDKDAPEQGANEIVNAIIPKYFPEGRIDLIIDETGHPLTTSVKVETLSLLKSVNKFNMQPLPGQDGKHHPYKLAVAVCKTIYRDLLDAKTIMFDYDDTLVGRGNTHPKASAFNRSVLVRLNEHVAQKVVICTGNSIKAINIPSEQFFEYKKDITVYADGGINKYNYHSNKDEELKPYKFVECIVPEAKFKTGAASAANIISTLRLGGIPATKIENRGDVMLSIKPIDNEYREIVRNFIALKLDRQGLLVKSAGRTTIEIASPLVEKAAAVELELQGLEGNLVFVGDEFTTGNDKSVRELAMLDKRIKCLEVSSPSDTAIFLSALNVPEQAYE